MGSFVVKELLENNVDVVNIDSRTPAEHLCPWRGADLEDLGAVISLLSLNEPDAVVHLAAIPNPLILAENVTFRINVMSTYNVFYAASLLGIKKIAFASTNSSYGTCFAKRQFLPHYLPIDESHPQLNQDVYGGSKYISEEIAKMHVRGYGLQAVALRYTFMERPGNYDSISFKENTEKNLMDQWRINGCFGYCDIRDAANATLKAIQLEGRGFEAVNVSADDTYMDVPTMEIIKRCYPGVKSAEIEGYGALYSNKAAKDLLGWAPKHSWRNEI